MGILDSLGFVKMAQIGTLGAWLMFAGIAHAHVLIPPVATSSDACCSQMSIPVDRMSDAVAGSIGEDGEVVLARSDSVTYTVAPGDTLGKIAKTYGVSVQEIRKRNRLKGDQIYIGQRLSIRSRTRAGSQEKTEHVVRAGETGGKIAQRYRVSLANLRRWNPNANIDRLSIGQKLVVYTEMGDGGSDRGASLPQAVGTPSRGRLSGGTQLVDSAGIMVRNASRAWGMPKTIDALMMTYGRMQAHFGDTTTAEIADISLQNGGKMTPHQSHQNGLDVDIAFIRKDCIDRVCKGQDVSPDAIDLARQWYIFRDWLKSDAVQFIFLSYEIQQAFYEYAKERGASEQELEKWFQYPRAKNATVGIIRHWSGHGNHFHVRFKEDN